MKSRPCHYRGYLMRSQSERIAARMLDSLGITWLYEPAVYSTDAGRYLPDFVLPMAEAFIEVKGDKPTDLEKEKAEALARLTGYKVMFLYGAHSPPMTFDDMLIPTGMVALVMQAGRWVKVPLSLVGELVYGGLGLEVGLRFALASGPMQGNEAYLPEERKKTENMMSSNNSPLNAQKVALHTVASERAIKAIKALATIKP